MGRKNETDRRSSEISRINVRIIPAPIIDLVAGHVLDSDVKIEDVLKRQLEKNPSLFINRVKTLENANYCWQSLENLTAIPASIYKYIDFYYSNSNNTILENDEPIEIYGVSPNPEDIELSIYKLKIQKLIEQKKVKK
jgi:hypothetical protein